MRPPLRPGKPVVIALFLAAGALAGAAGFLVNWLRVSPDTTPVTAPATAPAGARSVGAARHSLDALWAAQLKDLKDLSGRPVNLAAFKGQPLILNFWASWCGPCIEEMPDFQRASQTEAGKQVKFVGIGIDYARNMQPFADKLGITYTLLESGAEGLHLLKTAGNPSGALPFTLILDRDGVPVFRKLGKLDYVDLMAALARL